MVSAPNRRDFLGILAGSAAGLALPSTVFGRPIEGTSATITATRLSETLTLFSGAGANVVAVLGADEVVLVNGGLRERSAELLKLVAEHTDRKAVQALFNADWHPEYTGSNETLAKSGAKIIAHENTKQYIGAEHYVDWQKRTYKPLPANALASTIRKSLMSTGVRIRPARSSAGAYHADRDGFAGQKTKMRGTIFHDRKAVDVGRFRSKLRPWSLRRTGGISSEF